MSYNKSPLAPQEQFPGGVDDLKLRSSLVAMADRIDEQTRLLIYQTYTDPELNAIYRGMRNASVFERGSKSRVRRKLIEFPNGYVYRFVDDVLSALYGSDWLQNKRALKHDLVRPWLVVDKL